MRVYEATVIDKCAGAEPTSYESYVALASQHSEFVEFEVVPQEVM